MESPSHRSMNPLQQFYGGRKVMRWVVFVAVSAIATLYLTGQSYAPGSLSRGSHGYAKYLTPQELMERPISKDLQTIPKVFHQSWSSTELPAKFARWSDTCRKQHPDWEWVLWTDEDNEELVKRHFPWLLKTYKAMPGMIYRADLVRNLYMYMYGGVYADLDVECIRPIDQMFGTYNVSTVSHAKPRPLSTHDLQKNGRKAFFGRMGTDNGFDNSIPNAWMASTPGHPFFLVLAESVMRDHNDETKAGQSVEATTGPAKLFYMIEEYNEKEGKYEGDKIDKAVAKNPTSKQFTPKKGLGHSIEVLPFHNIYPYSWQRDGEAYRSVCWAARKTFNAERCKLLLATDHWPSYTITYWSHSWTGNGHDSNNLERLMEEEDEKEEKVEEES
ncbi:hypothetical protein PV10_02474 [Exophiala mesophila]|uniref:Uncharacterized protein n=1 Tax=Exophiala mesophila TaxID=212818 RepID=A0A0D1Y2C7_EXOME|nr:uncharacterized protein PV10_02474 [Exophiala mesophila]KIV94736.1 hypothetical protein PV10_02474 [Exophiala mesophila]